MSIEKLEEIINNDIEKYKNRENVNIILFREEVVNIFKDIYKQLAKKEDVINVDNIKIGGTD